MKMTPLGLRLARAAEAPETPWKLLAENVPVWPSPPPKARGELGDDFRYEATQGAAELLEALAARERAMGVDVTSDAIVVTNGAFDALALVTRHLVARGAERVVCAGPVLLNAADLFEAAGLETVVQDWPTLIGEQAWRAAGLGERDILYVNSPHNPTGACLDRETAEALLADRRRYGFTLVFDLVYDSFVHARDAIPTPLAYVGDWDGIFAVNSFSKNYGAPGLRVGWALADPSVLPHLAARFEWERIAVATSAQRRALALCRHGNAALVERVDAGRRLVLEWVEDQGFPASSASGGTQVWVDLRVGDAERFADVLMDDYGLIVTTGANYRPVTPSRLRIPTGPPPALLAEALEILSEARAAHGDRMPARRRG